MQVKTQEWNSPSLGKKVKVQVYGTGGTPILFFNTQCDKTGEDEEFLHSIEFQIENGLNLVYTLQKPDYKSVFDKSLDSKKRLINYLHIESFVVDELVPKIQKESSNDFLIISGVGNGAYLAMNMMLKHPRKFNKCLTLCGNYDMRPDFDGAQLEDFYYNNPVEYLPNLTDDYYLNELRQRDIRILSHSNAESLDQSELLSGYFDIKDIAHQLEIWGDDTPLELSTFKRMFANHIP